MPRFLLALIVASSMATSRASEVFTVDTEGVKTIKDPTQPMRIGDVEAYWTGHYRPSRCLPVVCEVERTSYFWDLGVFRFSDGSEPLGIQFGCAQGNLCLGFTCFHVIHLLACILCGTFMMSILWRTFFFCRRCPCQQINEQQVPVDYYEAPEPVSKDAPLP